MKSIKALFELYLSSSIHVALSVVALTTITGLSFKLSTDVALLCFNFFATITGYNFVKYYELAQFTHRRLSPRLKIIQVFSLVCFLLMIYFALQLQSDTQWVIGLLAVLTFMYAVPILPRHIFEQSHHNLRSVGGLKVYVIAVVWTGATVFMPILNAQISMESQFAITLVQRFLFIVVLMMPFEIRDLQYDSIQLATIPERTGIHRTKALGLIALALFFILDFFKKDWSQSLVIAHLIISVITFLFLFFADKKQGRYYSAFWVEAIPIVWVLLILIGL